MPHQKANLSTSLIDKKKKISNSLNNSVNCQSAILLNLLICICDPDEKIKKIEKFFQDKENIENDTDIRVAINKYNALDSLDNLEKGQTREREKEYAQERFRRIYQQGISSIESLEKDTFVVYSCLKHSALGYGELVLERSW
mgnify:CR=1 FL=1